MSIAHWIARRALRKASINLLALEVVAIQEVNAETVTLVTQAPVKIVQSIDDLFLSGVGVYPPAVNVRP